MTAIVYCHSDNTKRRVHPFAAVDTVMEKALAESDLPFYQG